MKRTIRTAALLVGVIGMLGAQSSLSKIQERTGGVKSAIEQKSTAHETSIADRTKTLEAKIQRLWDRIEKSTRYDYVSYSEDAKKKTKVAFEDGAVTVEVIDSEKNENRQGMLTSINDRIIAVRDDKDAGGDQYLRNQLTEGDMQRARDATKRTIYKAPDGETKVKYTATVPLKKDNMTERARIYYPYVKKFSQKHGISLDLTLSIIEVESAFNPYSDNGIAYGLMQLVPDSASDAAKTALGSKQYISIQQLKAPDLNINLGTALLNQFYTYKAYFEPFRDYQYKHELMGVAGYNCGAPRIRRWIDANRSLLKASDSDFYSALSASLPYETKRYIVKVPERRAKYQALVAAVESGN
ncbi:MAG: murein transglycosylase domain-containing protein [Spirochaetota bacterium]